MIPDLDKRIEGLQKSIVFANDDVNEKALIGEAFMEMYKKGARELGKSSVLTTDEIHTLLMEFNETNDRCSQEYGMLWVRVQERLVGTISGEPPHFFDYTGVYEKYFMQKLAVAVCEMLAE